MIQSGKAFVIVTLSRDLELKRVTDTRGSAFQGEERTHASTLGWEHACHF